MLHVNNNPNCSRQDNVSEGSATAILILPQFIVTINQFQLPFHTGIVIMTINVKSYGL